MKINSEGYGVIAKIVGGIIVVMIIFAVAAGALDWTKNWLFWCVEAFLFVNALIVLAFFREPCRPYVGDDDLVYAPADGRVVVIEAVDEKEFFGRQMLQISVFMSLTNVHINWFPVSGKVVYIQHYQGDFRVASHPKSSDENEHLSVAVDTGKEIVMYRQIAGLIARRIVSYVDRLGQQVKQNEKCGFIKFGSRVDVFLPVDTEVLVEIDSKVVGSQTPIARLVRRDEQPTEGKK